MTRVSKHKRVIFSLAVVAGLIAVSIFLASGRGALGNERPSINPWVDRTGEGLSVPACGSSTICGTPDTGSTIPCATCVNGSPSIDFTWINDGNPANFTCYHARIYAKFGTSDYFLVEPELPCDVGVQGSFTWGGGTGLVPPQVGTTYNYSIRYGSISDNFSPGGGMVAIDSSNLVSVYYEVGATTVLRAAISNDGGITWTKGPVIDTIGGAGAYSSADSIAPSTVFVSYYSGDTTHVLKFAKSTDGGFHWSTPVIVDSAGTNGTNSSIDALDASHINISYYDSTGTNLNFKHSENGGATWSAPIVIESTNGNIGSQSSIKALNTGVNTYTVFIAYRNDAAARVKVAKLTSSDGGVTWAAPVIISTFGSVSESGTYPSIDAADASNIFLVYDNTVGNVRFSKSTTGGGSELAWSNPVDIRQPWFGGSNGTAGTSLRAISASTIYVSYSYDSEELEPVFRKTSDGGATWSAPVVFNPGVGVNDKNPKLLAPDASNVFVSSDVLSHSADSGANWNWWTPKLISYYPNSVFSDNFDQAGGGTTNGWTKETGSTGDPHRRSGADGLGMIMGTNGTKGYRLLGSTLADPDDGVVRTIIGDYSSFTVKYDRTTKLASGSGEFVAAYSLNGGASWTALETMTGTNAYSTFTSAPISNSGNASVKLRFYVNASSNNFRAAVDNVFVQGSGPAGHIIKSGTFSTPTSCPMTDYVVLTNGLGVAPGNLVVGQLVTFNGTVQNTGGLAASAVSNTRLRLDIGNDGTYDVATFVNQSTGALAANGASEAESWANAWTAQVGTHLFEICADVGNAVSESNDYYSDVSQGNNCSTQTFTVFTGLAPSCSVSPTTINIGGSATWTATVSGGTGKNTFSWSGTDGLTGNATSTSKVYNTSGTKTATVTVTSGSQTVGPIACLNQLAVNSSPSVNAGPDQVITLPSSANLDGTVSDDGFPNPPAAVTITWSKDSGPGTVTFGNSSLIDTTAIFSAAGTYVLRLTANDSSLSSFDTIQIIVSPALPADNFSLTNTGQLFATFIPPGPVDSNKTTIKVNTLGTTYASNITLSYCLPDGGLCQPSNLPAGLIIHFTNMTTGISCSAPASAPGSCTPTLTSEQYVTGADFWVTVPSGTAPSTYTVVIKGAGADGTNRYTNPDFISLHIDTRDPGIIEVLRPIFETLSASFSKLIPEVRAAD